MVRISEIREKGVEVGVEIRKFAQRREGLADALSPPFALEAAELVVAQTKAESETGSITEGTAKTRRDGILGGVEAEIPREAGVGPSDRFARLEQSAGGVKEYGGDQERGTVTEFRSSRSAAPAVPREDRVGPTKKYRTAHHMPGCRF